MKKISQVEIDEFREMLEVEEANLVEELASHGRVQSETGDWQGSSSGLEGTEADPTDAADQIEELITNVPLVEELEARHTEVEDAIEKMDQGIYGLCEDCNKPISLDRLKANPAARTCVEHAE
ncbi:MAG: TraR/DksA C4-type zinc finger protein [bacterium]|nr:TraR/DksA C4-type zinc finger protein [bacterium]